MKKNFLVLGIAILATVALVRCGGGSSVKTPDAASFTSPTGSITNDNATTLVQSAINGATDETTVKSLFGLTSTSKLAAQAMKTPEKVASQYSVTADASCASTAADGKSGSVDVKCMSDAGIFSGEQCTASGSIEWAINNDATEVDVTLAGLGMDCSNSTVITSFKTASCEGPVKANGDLNALSTDAGFAAVVVCADISCSIDTTSLAFNGCFYGTEMLMDGEGGEVVFAGMTPSSDCSTVSSSWKTVAGDVTVTCNVTSSAAGCSPAYPVVYTVASCTVS